MHVFGPAIEQRKEDSGRVRQAFANAELVFDPALPVGTQVALTPLGYSLGILCALLMLWLLAFGARKRRYGTRGAPLRPLETAAGSPAGTLRPLS
jgi:hypothetical protein